VSRPPAQYAGLDLAEEALDEVEPGGTGRGEVHFETGMAQQPPADCSGLVGAVVVQDEVDVEVVRDLTVDLVGNFTNSVERCRECRVWWTWPVARSSAAKRLWTPWRT
jgi:hypothetical protein